MTKKKAPKEVYLEDLAEALAEKGWPAWLVSSMITAGEVTERAQERYFGMVNNSPMALQYQTIKTDEIDNFITCIWPHTYVGSNGVATMFVVSHSSPDWEELLNPALPEGVGVALIPDPDSGIDWTVCRRIVAELKLGGVDNRMLFWMIWAACIGEIADVPVRIAVDVGNRRSAAYAEVNGKIVVLTHSHDSVRRIMEIDAKAKTTAATQRPSNKSLN